ncbi:phosphatase [Clostridium boliviensis]|uniref:Phosphatase n=1 Tax=Clostridium boliviensis TaxID=318465 RepID=A0ABU4GTD8_9CLOT|nr:phosphatase [Clostridium boliviensis]MDW2799467.1 phosphatase [Clostridium boliviensis]
MIKRLAADLHTHTDVSRHGYSTVYENITAAKAAGLLAVGISNHCPAHPDGAPEGHFRNLRVLPEWVDGVRILRGAELNFTNFDGEIDLSPDTIENRLDYTIASFHEDVIAPGSIKDNTKAYLHAAENPLIDIIGHSGTACYEYDYERVIPEFGKKGKLVEINEGTFRVRKSSAQNCRTIARLCMKYSVSVIVSSDAHFCRSVGQFDEALAMLNSLNFPKQLVVNADMEQLESWFLRKRRR